MSKWIFDGIAAAGFVALSCLGAGTPASAQPGPGYGGWTPGWMGPGMMWGGGNSAPGCGGWGPGWMGPGMMWGGGWEAQQPADLNLTVPQVKSRMTQWLAASGNPHVKLGPVKQTDSDTISAEIVTADSGALVEEYEINRHTGDIQPAQN